MSKLELGRYSLYLSLDHDNMLYLSFMTFERISANAMVAVTNFHPSQNVADVVWYRRNVNDLMLFRFMKEKAGNGQYLLDEKAAHGRLARYCIDILWWAPRY
jgi:hypothetical protein